MRTEVGSRSMSRCIIEKIVEDYSIKSSKKQIPDGERVMKNLKKHQIHDIEVNFDRASLKSRIRKMGLLGEWGLKT